MKYSQQSLDNLIEEIENSYQKMRTLFEEFPNKESSTLVVGDYSFKDVVAHMESWEQFLIDSLEEIKNKTIKVGKPNIKKINLGFYEKNKRRDLDEVMTTSLKTHSEMIDYIKVIDYKILSDPEPYYPDKNDIYTMITHCTTRHYPWAINHLRKFLKSLES